MQIIKIRMKIKNREEVQDMNPSLSIKRNLDKGEFNGYRAVC